MPIFNVDDPAYMPIFYVGNPTCLLKFWRHFCRQFEVNSLELGRAMSPK